MFSITPAISRSTLSAISAARRATFWATGCGVVTMQELAPAAAAGRASSRRRRCPAAGRRAGSRARPTSTSSRNCVSALWSIGPRHTTAASSSTKKPIDMTFTPWRLERHDLALGVDLRALAAERRTCAGSSSPRRRRRARRRACRRRPARRRGWRSASTCRRRPCPSRCRRRWRPGPARPRAARRAAELALQAGLLVVGEDVEGDVDAGARRRARRPPAATAVWKWLRIGQPGVVSETVTSTTPPSCDVDRADHLELDDVAAQLGVDDGLERLEDLARGKACRSLQADGRRRPLPRRETARRGGPLRGRRGTASAGEICDRQLSAGAPLQAPGGEVVLRDAGDALLDLGRRPACRAVMPVCTTFSTRAPSRSACARDVLAGRADRRARRGCGAGAARARRACGPS